MTTVRTIVEGYGEVDALPVLLRRVAARDGIFHVNFPKPHRVPKSQMLTDNILRASELQRRQLGDEPGGVLILVDADDVDPDALVAKVEGLTRTADFDPFVVIAVKEFEAWFLAGIESLRSHRDVLNDASFAGDPEAPRGAKEALAAMMSTGYTETRHQAAFASMLDLDTSAQRSTSLSRLIDVCRECYSFRQ